MHLGRGLSRRGPAQEPIAGTGRDFLSSVNSMGLGTAIRTTRRPARTGLKTA